MASPVPKNVAAAVGLVPTVLGGVRRLPGKAVQLPVMALGTAMAGVEAARREYDELAQRGDRVIARLRGTSFDELEDRVEDALSGTPVAGLYDKVEDALEDTAQAARRAVRNVEATNSSGPARVDSAATPEVVEQVEQVASAVDAPLITEHSDLPLPDYDHMTLGSLRGRLRSLDIEQLVALRDYEKSKADRLPVVTMLDNRIAKLASGASAPSGGVPQPPAAAAAQTKPPKTLGATAAATNSSVPPRTKVRIT